MTKVSLTVGERLAAVMVLNMVRDLTLEKLRLLMRVIEKLVVGENERVAISLQSDDTGVRWDPKAPEQEVELTSEEHVLLKETFRKRDSEHKYTSEDRFHLLGFVDKLFEEVKKSGER